MTEIEQASAVARLLSACEYPAGAAASLLLEVTASQAWAAGGRLWLCVDIRQECGGLQAADPDAAGYVSAEMGDPPQPLPVRQPGPGNQPCRSLDWLPDMPEFVHLAEVEMPRALAAGERLRITVGAGPGFRLPSNSIEQFKLWVVADPTGQLRCSFDERRGYFRSDYGATPVVFLDGSGRPVTPPRPLAASPALRILGLPAAELQAVVPSLLKCGEPFPLRLSALDSYMNPAAGRLEQAQAWLEPAGGLAASAPLGVRWERPDGSDSTLTASLPGLPQAGDYCVRVQTGGLATVSNTLRVVEGAPDYRPYWGDLHSMLFNQRPYAEYYRYARDTMLLDFATGMLFSYNIVLGDVWEAQRTAVEQFNHPGGFVTFTAVECGIANGGMGHKNVYLIDHLDPPFMAEVREPVRRPTFRSKLRPDALIIEGEDGFWAEVERRQGLVMCHHTVEWSHHHPRLERFSEVYSKWGRCEYAGNPDWYRHNRPFQEALAHGLKVGIVAGTDTHDSRAANRAAEWALPHPGGLTAIFARSLTRADLWEALWARRTCASTGQRTVVRLMCGGHWMGEEIAVPGGRPELDMDVLGDLPICRLALLRDNETVALWSDLGPGVQLSWREPEALPGTHAYYLRVTHSEGRMAWSSPIWITTG